MIKKILIALSLINSGYAISQSLEAITSHQAQISDQSTIDTAREFRDFKNKLINFHSLKVKDHNQVLKCVHGAKDVTELNLCNEPLKKYFEDEDEQERRKSILQKNNEENSGQVKGGG